MKTLRPRCDLVLVIAVAIQWWAYPDFAYTKVMGVPLFSRFMYAAVGSYIIQAWRLFDMRIRHHPPYWMATLMALLIYANFFTHHFIGDYRWYLGACTPGLYARATVAYRPLDRERTMPLKLLVIMTFTIVVQLKHIKARIHVPD